MYVPNVKACLNEVSGDGSYQMCGNLLGCAKYRISKLINKMQSSPPCVWHVGEEAQKFILGGMTRATEAL